MTIFFDIDGVIRRLDLACFGVEPDHWNFKDNLNRNVIKIVNDDPSLCEKAKGSEYLDFVNSLNKVVFLSNQLPNWIPYTDKWLNRNVLTSYEVIYTKNNNKFEYMSENDMIFDDYPGFDNYDQVLLVDRLYNRKVEVPIRIKNVDEMRVQYNKFK